jgi:hypothetical protein
MDHIDIHAVFILVDLVPLLKMNHRMLNNPKRKKL